MINTNNHSNKIILIVISIIFFSSSLMSENIYRLALKVAKVKEVKDIIRHERRLFANIKRYYIDVGEWPEDSDNGNYGTLNDYLIGDSGQTISNTVHGRVLNYTINNTYKIITIYGGQENLDEEQLEIYRARVEAKDKDRNATYLFEKLDRKGLIGAQKKYIILTSIPTQNEETNYPVGTIGYSHYTFDGEVRWKLYVVKIINNKRVWVAQNI